MKIAIVGMGYVGLSLSCLLSKMNTVYAVDVSSEKVDRINSGLSPIADFEVKEALFAGGLRLTATVDTESAYHDADYVIISTPTDYNDASGSFDTSSVEGILDEVSKVNPAATVVVKSTVPVGYTESIAARYDALDILFSPEFLREGYALYDNLYPSRVVVGIPHKQGQMQRKNRLRLRAEDFARLLVEGSADQGRINDDGSIGIPVLIVGSTEAEAIKLFSNTYLALRVSYFNELDTFAASHGIDVSEIIGGVCLDPRIGRHYNNPSFGYGGYCLPKDTKQLLFNYKDIPQNLIKATVDSNQTRKEFIAKEVLSLKPKTIGIFRLVMKEGSDNFRQSSVCDIVDLISAEDVEIIIYEPLVASGKFEGHEVVDDLDGFKKRSDIIVSNRFNDELSDVSAKVYSRDLWHRD